MGLGEFIISLLGRLSARIVVVSGLNFKNQRHVVENSKPLPSSRASAPASYICLVRTSSAVGGSQAAAAGAAGGDVCNCSAGQKLSAVRIHALYGFLGFSSAAFRSCSLLTFS